MINRTNLKDLNYIEFIEVQQHCFFVERRGDFKVDLVGRNLVDERPPVAVFQGILAI